MPQPDAEVPDYNRRKPSQQTIISNQDKPQASSEFVLDLGGGSEPTSTPALRAKFKALQNRETDVRKASAVDRPEGWGKLLRDEFTGAVDALIALPVDAQGNGFHAQWDQPTIGGLETPRLKLWYGKEGDDLTPEKGKKLAIVQMNDRYGMVIDCTDLATSAQSSRPVPEIKDTFAGLAMSVPDALKDWAERSARRRLHVDLSHKPQTMSAPVVPAAKANVPVLNV